MKGLLNPESEINQISEKDLIEALKKVNQRNLAIRKSFRHDKVSMSFQATPKPYN